MAYSTQDSDRVVDRQIALQHVAVIINPVSGVNTSAEAEIRRYLDAIPGLNCTVYLTEPLTNAKKLAQQAVREGVQAVIAYGGDGTMAEAAAALQGTGVPLGILPGGTANVMAVELGIPLALDAALNLIFRQPNRVQVVDMGEIDSQPFLLRAGIGYEAESTATAPRSEKRHSGRLAYFRHALRKLRSIRPARYAITVDGVAHIRYGITCLICNSTSTGIPHLRLAPQSDVSDGLLDVMVIDGSMISLLRLVASTLRSLLPCRKEAASPVNHWQGRDITVEMRPRQLIAYDGEVLKKAKRVSARIIPAALNVIVPPEA